MKFAFIVHPINREMSALFDLAREGTIRAGWGSDVLNVCGQLHDAIEETRRLQASSAPTGPRVVDEISDLTSSSGTSAEGRLYEVSMSPEEILGEPQRALDEIQQAVEMAMEWGASIVGLGSMTGIVGGRGTHLAQRNPIAITTGNSLTVYSTLQCVYRIVDELEIDLREETVTVVGIPGSIASAVAALISPQCGKLQLVGRNLSAPATKLARQLDAEFVLDIERALSTSRVIISATSAGNCIDPVWLRPGSIVVDVGVPSDIQRNGTDRDDVLILTGGFVGLPPAMPLNSTFLWFQHGVIPSCLGETIVLALSERAESFSLGRKLHLDAIQEIGAIATEQGFDFSRLHSFGRRLDDSTLVRFQKLQARSGSIPRPKTVPPVTEIAGRASDLFARHINPVLMALGNSGDFIKTFVRGEGAYLFDKNGERYLDFVAGFGSMNLGHNHPGVVEAVSSALQQQAPGFAQSAVNPYAALLAKELVCLSPPELEMVFFTNSGTEAVEAALKLARKTTGRTGFLSCSRGFHGKSVGALSIAGNDEYRLPFGPLLPDCESIPFGDFDALERALMTRRFAAFVVEPVQAEGGMYVPPVGYLREAQALCRATGTLLVADEIQTGMGRTGKFFAVDADDVHPDILTVAKSLGGGLIPIGAMLTRRDLWMNAYGSVQTFALHSSTFGGGSLACAAGLATLNTIADEGLAENAAARGRQLVERISEICRQHQCVREIRGRGLLLGLEFAPLPDDTKAHWKDFDRTGMASMMAPGLGAFVDSFHAMHAMQTLLNAHGVFTQTTRSHPRVLRIQPPLTVTQQQIDQFCDALAETCREIDYSTRLIDAMVSKSNVGDIDWKEGNATEVPSEFQSPR